MKRKLVRIGLAAMMVSTLALVGCGGGSDGSQGPAGPTGATGPAGPTGPTGAAGASASSFNSNSAAPTADQIAAWPNLGLTATVAVQGVTIASPPVVKFTVKDAAGNGITGLANTSKASTAIVASNPNVSFTLAKLVPASNGSPSKWISYNILKPPTVAQAAGTIPDTDSCTPDFKWCGTYPAADNQGTLVDNGGGSYTYTFYRDPKLVKDLAATLVDSKDGLSKKADLGDLTFDATATHRLGIMITGNLPGTGTNTPTGVASSTAAVAMVNAINSWYDFRPDGAAVTNTRQVVSIDSCAACHDGKGLAHGTRKDPNLCVTCHTDQIKYSFNAGEAPSTTDAAGVRTLTGGVTGATNVKRSQQAIVGGRAVGNYPNMVHKVHMGDQLLVQGYNFNANGGAMMFNTNGLPMDRRNCTKCHSGDTPTSPLQAVKTTDGNNWKTVPSRLACGSCHDGINFATGTGTTLAGATTGHGIGSIGGAQADDATCGTCHTVAGIGVAHRTDVATPNNPVASEGVATITYDLNSVTVNASKLAVLKFRILKNGTPVTLNIPTLVRNAATGAMVVDPNYEPITGFAGGPSLYVAFAVPQDGITAPADFNKSYNASLANLLIASGSPKAGVVTGPDGSGYYTATLTGDLVGQPLGAGCVAATPPALTTCNSAAILASPLVIPTTAKMVTGAIIGTFTQKGLAKRPYVAANVSVNNVAATGVAKGTVAAYGGVVNKSMLAKLVATGYTARRVAVESARCNSCHEQLGAIESDLDDKVNATTGKLSALGAAGFHGGARNDPTSCAICHNTSQTSGGWTSNASTFVHGIHGKDKRSVIYNWHATLGTLGATQAQNTYGELYTFNTPGVLKDCQQCHLPNTVNFGASGQTLLPNLLWSTTATGSITTGITTSPYIVSGTNYGNNFSYTAEGATVSAYTPSGGTLVAAHVAGAGGETIQAQSTTLVSSPISAACFSCHDTSSAIGHMKSNGGVINGVRGVLTASSNAEGCLVCHGAGKDKDAAVIHHK